MTERADALADLSFPYDVFISYNRADRIWVREKLLPRLEAAHLRTLTPDRDFIPGWPRQRNIERAVAGSRHTLTILTPAFDDWDILATLMASHDDPLAYKLKLLPLLLADCRLPETIAALSLNYLDFTDERAWEAEFDRLIRTLKTSPPPLPSPITRTWHFFLRYLPPARHLLLLSLATLTLVSIAVLLQLRSLPQEVAEARQPDGFLFAYWPAPTATPISIPPMPDDGSFNIAVAPFTRLDNPADSSIFVQDIQNLSERLYTSLEEDFSCPVPVLLRGPKEVQPVSGKPTFAENSDLRTPEAEEYARTNNVHLLIYGVITQTGNYFVQPEFYISPEDFDYGSEIVGSDRLGQPIQLNLPLDISENWSETQIKLYARIQALQYLICGLAHFHVNNHERAWDQFQQAALIQDWEDDEGKEVVYLLMGAAKLRASHDPKTEQPTEALNAAFEAFKRASELNDVYARSYLGLGGVALQQATFLNPHWPNNVNQAKLREAEHWYLQSLKVKDQPDSAHVPLKAAYGLGQIYSIGHQYAPADWSEEQARIFFTQVMTIYEAEASFDVIWFAGHAYANLAWLDMNKEQPTIVLSECQQAIKLLEQIQINRPNDLIAYCWAWIGSVEEKLNHLNEACQAYHQAIELGKDNNLPTKDLQDWQAGSARLKCGEK